MQINMPVDDKVISQLKIYDMVEITGKNFYRQRRSPS